METPKPDTKIPRLLWPWFVLAGAMALAAGLRLLHLADESPWGDEIASLQHLGEPSLAAFLRAIRHSDPVMTPLYFTLQYVWTEMFADSVYALRSLSVVCGVLTVPVVFGIGRRLYGDFAGCAAALCVATNGMHVQYSQEVRMYALCWLLAACSVYTFLRLREGPGWGGWLLHFTANAGLLATHFFNALLLPVEAALLFWPPFRRARAAAWIAGNGLLVLALGGWILTMDFERMTGASEWLDPPGIEALGQMVSWYSGAGGFQVRAAVPGILRAADPLLKAACVLVFVGAGAWLALATWRKTSPEPGAHSRAFAFALLATWTFLPAVLLAVESYVYRPAFTGRYVGYASLAPYVMLGGALASIARPRLRRAAALLVALLFATQASILALSRPVRTDWYGATALIAAQGEGYPVYASSHLAAKTLRYYLPEAAAPIECPDTAAFVEAAPWEKNQRFWLVFDPTIRNPSAPVLERILAAGTNYNETEFAGRYGPLEVYLCGTE